MSEDFRITANMPSRDFAKTREFYSRLGFEDRFVSDGWMVLGQGDQTIEFFPHPNLNPKESWFSTYFRTGTLDALLEKFQSANLSTDPKAIHRLTGIETIENGPRIFHFVDLDGTLVRCIEDFDE